MMHPGAGPAKFDDQGRLADAIVEKVGKTIVLALPAALGKANHIVNALYAKAVNDRTPPQSKGIREGASGPRSIRRANWARFRDRSRVRSSAPIQAANIPPEFFVGVDGRFEVMAAPGLVDSMEHGQRLAADPAVLKLMIGRPASTDPGEALRQAGGSRHSSGIPCLRRCLLHHRHRTRRRRRPHSALAGRH